MLVFMFFLIAKTRIVCIISHINTKQDISMDCHPVQVKAVLKMGKANLPKVAGLYARAPKPDQRFPVAPPLKARSQ